jgi:signal peptidase I
MGVQDRDQLKAEAAKLRKNYHYLRKALKQRPADRELRRRAETIQARYTKLQQELQNLPKQGAIDAQPRAAPPPPMDMSVFEPKSYSPPPPVAIPRGDGWENPLQNLHISRRTIWTSLLIAILLVTSPFYYLLFFKGMAFYEVPTNSMLPTLVPGDRFAAIVPAEYRRGDVIVAEDPADPAAYLVKRLVALPGDTVRVANNKLWINDEPINEPYIREGIEYAFDPVTLGADEVFLLGDNRNESEDSHSWGRGFPMRKVVGRVFYIYYPGDRRGRFESQQGAFALVPGGTGR